MVFETLDTVNIVSLEVEKYTSPIIAAIEKKIPNGSIKTLQEEEDHNNDIEVIGRKPATKML
jgi:hypothetical protein